MDTEARLEALATSYDACAVDREEVGEPDWRDDIRDDFAARLEGGAPVLEIGAGVGYTARWFLDSGFNITATDLSPANVALIRDKGVPAEVRDMADLEFPNESFEGVWGASCLMHIPDAELPTVLEEVARVISPGGFFWAGTWGGPDGEGVWEEDWYEPKRFYSIRSDERMQSFYEPAFEVVDFHAFDPRPDLEWHYQSALLRKADGS